MCDFGDCDCWAAVCLFVFHDLSLASLDRWFKGPSSNPPTTQPNPTQPNTTQQPNRPCPRRRGSATSTPSLCRGWTSTSSCPTKSPPAPGTGASACGGSPQGWWRKMGNGEMGGRASQRLYVCVLLRFILYTYTAGETPLSLKACAVEITITKVTRMREGHARAMEYPSRSVFFFHSVSFFLLLFRLRALSFLRLFNLEFSLSGLSSDLADKRRLSSTPTQTTPSETNTRREQHRRRSTVCVTMQQLTQSQPTESPA